MTFIKDDREREKTFYSLWEKEVETKLNSNHYKLCHRNDVYLFPEITYDELREILVFCEKYNGLFKYYWTPNYHLEEDIEKCYKILKKEDSKGLLLKHLFDF